jgi:hypothetical protein
MAPDWEISARFPGLGMCAANCIEVCAGHQDAKTIGPYQPHSIFLRGAFGSVRQRPRTVAKPGADNESAFRAPLSCLVDEATYRCGRRSNNHEFGHKRQLAKTVDRRNAVDLGIVCVD